MIFRHIKRLTGPDGYTFRSIYPDPEWKTPIRLYKSISNIVRRHLIFLESYSGLFMVGADNGQPGAWDSHLSLYQ
jgi:hypothetical protein